MALLVVVLAGCGQTAEQPAGIATATSSSPGAPTPVSPSPTPGKTYVDARYGYSSRYPENWYELGNFGPPDGARYFSNEQVGAPLELDAMGIWLGITVTATSCPAEPSPAPGDATLHAGDQVVTRHTGPFGPPAGEGGWAIGANVPGPGPRCYEFRFLTSSQQARDQNLELADQVIASLRVGQ